MKSTDTWAIPIETLDSFSFKMPLTTTVTSHMPTRKNKSKAKLQIPIGYFQQICPQENILLEYTLFIIYIYIYIYIHI